MATVTDIIDYLQHMRSVGFGQCRVVLCRRGMDLTQEVMSMVPPCDGERVSEDGSQVYLSCRRMEE